MLRASLYLTAPPELHFSPAAECEFYRGIQTSNGTRKMTEPRRVAPMDDLFFTTLARLGTVPRTVMDIGVSSGITTAEWLRGFRNRGIDVTMVATDLVMSVYIYDLGKHLKALTERNGHLLQLEVFGTGIRTYTRWRDYFLAGFLWRKSLCAFARSRLSRSMRKGPYYLVSPLLRNDRSVRLIDDDILAQNSSEWVASADVIRVANVIQRIYFTEDEIKRAVENLRERCRGEGSLVVVCRNRGSRLDGSILRMTNLREFALEARLGQGSEVERFFTNSPFRAGIRAAS